MPAGTSVARAVVLRNTRPSGALEWALDPAAGLVSAGVLRAAPAAGVLGPGERVLVRLTLSPGAPRVIDEDVGLRVAVPAAGARAHARACVSRTHPRMRFPNASAYAFPERVRIRAQRWPRVPRRRRRRPRQQRRRSARRCLRR